MPLTPDLADALLASCRLGAPDAAAALSRAFARPLEMKGANFRAERFRRLPPEWNGPGLLIVLKCDGAAAVLGLPESSGLLPNWYRQAEATNLAELDRLAHELGQHLLPAEFTPTAALAPRWNTWAIP